MTSTNVASTNMVDITRIPAKAIYLANRHPRLSRAEFADRWRRHALVGGTADPRIREIAAMRYCLTQAPGDLLASASDEHDGVALLGLRSVVSIPTLASMLVQNELAYADELRTFERPVEDFTLQCASQLLVAGAETSSVVLHFVRRRPELSPGAFFRGLGESAMADLSGSGLAGRGLRRWVRNVLVAPPARGFAYDCVDELWFDSLDDVARAGDAIEASLERSEPHANRLGSLLLVTSVIERLGPDLPT